MIKIKECEDCGLEYRLRSEPDFNKCIDFFEKILIIYKHWYKLSVLIRLSDNNVEKTEKI